MEVERVLGRRDILRGQGLELQEGESLEDEDEFSFNNIFEELVGYIDRKVQQVDENGLKFF